MGKKPNDTEEDDGIITPIADVKIKMKGRPSRYARHIQKAMTLKPGQSLTVRAPERTARAASVTRTWLGSLLRKDATPPKGCVFEVHATEELDVAIFCLKAEDARPAPKPRAAKAAPAKKKPAAKAPAKKKKPAAKGRAVLPPKPPAEPEEVNQDDPIEEPVATEES